MNRHVGSLVFVGLAGLAAAAGFQASAPPPSVTIVVTSELRARVRRCGCNGPQGPTTVQSKIVPTCCGKYREALLEANLPDLGGLPERSAWLAKLRARGADPLQLDAGDLLFPGLAPEPYEWAEWLRRARLLVEAYGMLGVGAYVPGELDLGLGRKTLQELLAPARFSVLAANLVDANSGKPLFRGSATFDVKGVRIGVVGLFSPPASEATTALLAREGLTLTPPVEAVRRETARLRDGGAQVLVLLAHASEADVRALVREVTDFDLAFATHPELPSGTASASPMEGLTAVSRSLPGGGAPVVAQLRVVRGAHGVTTSDETLHARSLHPRLERQLSDHLARRARATTAEEKTFLDEQIVWTRSQLAATRATVTRPRHEVTLRLDLLEARDLREGQSPELLAAIEALKTDLERLELEPSVVSALEAPAPGPGGRLSAFLTGAACASCHPRQAEVWRGSAHARAWSDLERAGNTKDPECVRCHTIGFRQPGGFAEVRRATHAVGRETLDYRNVQCEACHGPRAGHPATAGIGTHLPTVETCHRCHDPEHDPGFDRRRDKPTRVAAPVCVRDPR